jgi:cell division protein FtsQ
MSPVSAPSDRRFHRAHIKPVRRRRRWRKVALAITAVLALAAAAGAGARWIASAVAQTPLLAVDRIDVRGNARMSSEDVARLLDGLRGENILWTDLDAWRERLLEAPWVLDASLRRTLPSTIEIAMTEREPIGFARIEGVLYLIDRHGLVIDRHDGAYADLDLPIVDGLGFETGGDESAGGRRARTAKPEAAELAARVIAAFAARPDVSRRLSQIDVSSPHNVAVRLSDDPVVLYLGEAQFLERVTAYLELADALRQRHPEIEYVDLRVEDKVILREAGAGRQAPVVPASAAGVPR